MSFEQETLSRVIEARNLASQARATGNVAAVGTAEVALKGAVTQLFGLAESYPDLKANNNFQQLMTRISASEDSISDRREFYNEAVNLNNTRREEFPDLVVARMFGFAAADLLTFDPEELKDVDIGNLFDR
jgi:LemA protein